MWNGKSEGFQETVAVKGRRQMKKRRRILAVPRLLSLMRWLSGEEDVPALLARFNEAWTLALSLNGATHLS